MTLRGALTLRVLFIAVLAILLGCTSQWLSFLEVYRGAVRRATTDALTVQQRKRCEENPETFELCPLPGHCFRPALGRASAAPGVLEFRWRQEREGPIIEVDVPGVTGPCSTLRARLVQPGHTSLRQHLLVGILISTLVSFFGAFFLVIQPLVRRILRDQEALAAHARALEAHLAEIAHDLRTPLSSLQLQLEVTCNDVQDPTLRASLLSCLEDTVYAAGLAEDLRLRCRLETGWNPLASGAPPVDLTTVVETTVARAAALGRLRKITVDAAVPDDPLFIPGDRLALQRLLSNLLENAILHVHEGAHVSVELRQEGASFLLKILDDGPGLSRELRTTSRHGGLGLSIIRTLGEALGISLHFSPLEPTGLCVTLKGRVLPAPLPGGLPAAKDPSRSRSPGFGA